MINTPIFLISTLTLFTSLSLFKIFLVDSLHMSGEFLFCSKTVTTYLAGKPHNIWSWLSKRYWCLPQKIWSWLNDNPLVSCPPSSTQFRGSSSAPALSTQSGRGSSTPASVFIPPSWRISYSSSTPGCTNNGWSIISHCDWTFSDWTCADPTPNWPRIIVFDWTSCSPSSAVRVYRHWTWRQVSSLLLACSWPSDSSIYRWSGKSPSIRGCR